jgi:hypothetical protein
MTKLFGWCLPPEGARPVHERCPGTIGGPDGIRCGCECHEEEA